MKILFITYEMPFIRTSGDNIYTSDLLQRLMEAGHDVHVVCYQNKKLSGEEVSAANELIADSSCTCTFVQFSPRTLYSIVLSQYPGMIANRRSGIYSKTVRNILDSSKPFDVIIVNHFKMTWIIDRLKKYLDQIPTIHISHNVESRLSKSVYQHVRNPLKKIVYYLDWIKTKRYEKDSLHRFDAVTAICDYDRLIYQNEYGLPRIFIVKPAVPFSKYENISTTNVGSTAIICGNFRWEPKKLNLLKFLNCKSFRRLGENGIKLLIVGNAYARLVEHVNNHFPNVFMTGSVQTVEQYYSRCSIAIIPELMGGGFKVKLIEAALYRKPVIAIKGAVTESSFLPGEHFLECNNFDHIVRKMLELVSMPKEIERISNNAYELVTTHYTIEKQARALRDALSSINADQE